MSYKVLSLKWRPQTFEEIVGQQHVTQTLINAFKKDRIAQAYLFTGPRGVGKTTTARLVGKALNCLTSPGNPCNQCSNCIEIAESRNMDVLEIDGASNRGIEEIRNLRELIKYAPVNGQYKVFIIDEVHMLTPPAFNALLKTLEEPPKHGKFILATTDAFKLPATIVSRCQRFDYHRLQLPDISNQIQKILDDEKISIDQESVDLVARKADGSMRDALSILDQVIAYCGETIKSDDTMQVLGLIPTKIYFEFTEVFRKKDGNQLIDLLQNVRLSGMSVAELVTGLSHHIHDLMIAALKNGDQLLEYNQELQSTYKKEGELWDKRDLLRIANTCTNLIVNIRHSTQPMIVFELAMMKILEMDSSVSIESLLSGNYEETRPKPLEQNPVQKKLPASPLPEIKKIAEKDIPNKPEKKDEIGKQEISVAKHSLDVGINDKNADQNINVSIESIENAWMEIIDSIQKIRPSIGNVLEHCLIDSINNNQLKLKIVDQPKFSLDLCEKNRRIIENEINRKFNSRFHIQFSLEKSENVPLKPKSDQLNKPELNKGNEGSVTKIIELFDGEIER